MNYLIFITLMASSLTSSLIASDGGKKQEAHKKLASEAYLKLIRTQIQEGLAAQARDPQAGLHNHFAEDLRKLRESSAYLRNNVIALYSGQDADTVGKFANWIDWECNHLLYPDFTSMYTRPGIRQWFQDNESTARTLIKARLNDDLQEHPKLHSALKEIATALDTGDKFCNEDNVDDKQQSS